MVLDVIIVDATVVNNPSLLWTCVAGGAFLFRVGVVAVFVLVVFLLAIEVEVLVVLVLVCVVVSVILLVKATSNVVLLNHFSRRVVIRFRIEGRC